MSNAFPFITVNDAGEFKVHPEAEAYLRSLPSDVKCVAPVCIAGKSRTGKSFLLNALSGASMEGGGGQGGFSVGHSVEACTRGIWMSRSSHTLPLPGGGKCAVLFLDTEGIGNPGSTPEHDARIFSLAVLLSSLLVFNSLGAIDEESLSTLSFVTQLSQLIQASPSAAAGGGELDLASFAPSFLWVLRDHALGMYVDEDGREVSPDEYLEQALDIPDNASFAAEDRERNRTRRVLSSFFKDRHCATLIRPVEDEALLTRADTLPPGKLRRQFREQLGGLKDLVLTRLAQPKRVLGKGVSGTMLAAMAATYVAAINAGAVPVITSAWESAVEEECVGAGRGAVGAWFAAMAAQCPPTSLPKGEGEVRSVALVAMASALAPLEALPVSAAASRVRESAREEMEAGMASLLEANEKASLLGAKRLLQSLWTLHVEPVLPTTSSSSPSSSYSPAALAAAFALLEKDYLSRAKGPAVHTVLATYLLASMPGAVEEAGRAGAASAKALVVAGEEAVREANARVEALRGSAGVSGEEVEKLRGERQAAVLDAEGAKAALAIARQGVEAAARERSSLQEEISALKAAAAAKAGAAALTPLPTTTTTTTTPSPATLAEIAALKGEVERLKSEAAAARSSAIGTATGTTTGTTLEASALKRQLSNALSALEVMKERRNMLAKRLMLEKQFSAEVKARGGGGGGGGGGGIPPPPPFTPEEDELATSGDDVGGSSGEGRRYASNIPSPLSSGGGGGGGGGGRMGLSVERQLQAAGVKVSSSSSSSSASSKGLVVTSPSIPSAARSLPRPPSPERERGLASPNIYADVTDSDADDYNEVYRATQARAAAAASAAASATSPTSNPTSPSTGGQAQNQRGMQSTPYPTKQTSARRGEIMGGGAGRGGYTSSDGGLTSGTEDDIPIERAVAGNFGHYTEPHHVKPASPGEEVGSGGGGGGGGGRERRPSESRRVHFSPSDPSSGSYSTSSSSTPTSASSSASSSSASSSSLTRQNSLSAAHMTHRGGEEEVGSYGGGGRGVVRFQGLDGSSSSSSGGGGGGGRGRSNSNAQRGVDVVAVDALGRQISPSPSGRKDFTKSNNQAPPPHVPCCVTPCCVIH